MTADRSPAAPSGGLPQPSIRTARLELRPFRPTDADRVTELAGEREIAATTTHIPHPYGEGVAAAWIASQPGRRAAGEAVVFAVESKVSVESKVPAGLVGAVGLEIDAANRQAELGYWIGKPYWGRGLATEAASAVLRYAFEQVGLNRVHAGHFAHNPASGRVLEKIGMRPEGCRRQHVLKWGSYVDLIVFGILREEYEAERG